MHTLSTDFPEPLNKAFDQTYLIDLRTGVLRPNWTRREAVGALAIYIDANSEEPTTRQMELGYAKSAGVEPYAFDVDRFEVLSLDEVGEAVLRSKTYDETFEEISRTKGPDGAIVIMFRSAMTGVILDGELIWLSRLD